MVLGKSAETSPLISHAFTASDSRLSSTCGGPEYHHQDKLFKTVQKGEVASIQCNQLDIGGIGVAPRPCPWALFSSLVISGMDDELSFESGLCNWHLLRRIHLIRNTHEHTWHVLAWLTKCKSIRIHPHQEVTGNSTCIYSRSDGATRTFCANEAVLRMNLGHCSDATLDRLCLRCLVPRTVQRPLIWPRPSQKKQSSRYKCWEMEDIPVPRIIGPQKNTNFSSLGILIPQHNRVVNLDTYCANVSRKAPLKCLLIIEWLCKNWTTSWPLLGPF